MEKEAPVFRKIPERLAAMAVSYTHLDVYKRQVIIFSLSVEEPARRLTQWVSGMTGWSVEMVSPMTGLIPLFIDVYKRQGKACCFLGRAGY